MKILKVRASTQRSFNVLVTDETEPTAESLNEYLYPGDKKPPMGDDHIYCIDDLVFSDIVEQGCVESFDITVSEV